MWMYKACIYRAFTTVTCKLQEKKNIDPVVDWGCYYELKNKFYWFSQFIVILYN